MKKKTLYWDIATEVRLTKAQKKLKKHKLGHSKITRLYIASPKFDQFVEELNISLGIE